MGLPDEQKGDRKDKQEDDPEGERADGSESKEEARGDEHKETRDQLYEALSATDAKEKDYHVRQAIQLLQIEE